MLSSADRGDGCDLSSLSPCVAETSELDPSRSREDILGTHHGASFQHMPGKSDTFHSLFLWSFQNCLEQAMAKVLQHHAPEGSVHRPMFDFLVGDCLDFVAAKAATALHPSNDELQRLSQLNGSCLKELMPEGAAEPPKCAYVGLSQPSDKTPGAYSVLPQQLGVPFEHSSGVDEVDSVMSINDGGVHSTPPEPSAEIRNIESTVENEETQILKVLWAMSPRKDVAGGTDDLGDPGCVGHPSSQADAVTESAKKRLSEHRFHELVRLRDERAEGDVGENLDSETRESGPSSVSRRTSSVATLTRAKLMEIHAPTMRYNLALRRRLSGFWLIAPYLDQLPEQPRAEKVCNAKLGAACGDRSLGSHAEGAPREFVDLSLGSSHSVKRFDGDLHTCSKKPNATSAASVEVERLKRNDQGHGNCVEESLKIIYADVGDEVGIALGLGNRDPGRSLVDASAVMSADGSSFASVSSQSVDESVRKSPPAKRRSVTRNKGSLDHQAEDSFLVDATGGKNFCGTRTGCEVKSVLKDDRTELFVDKGTSSHAPVGGPNIRDVFFAPGRRSADALEVGDGRDVESTSVFRGPAGDTASLLTEDLDSLDKEDCHGADTRDETNNLGLSGVAEFCAVQEAVRKEAEELRNLVHFYSVFISECLQNSGRRCADSNTDLA